MKLFGLQPSGTRAASSLDQSAAQTSTRLCCLPATQTATVLCELAEEAGQSQLSHDGTVIEDDTGDVSNHPEPAGYCQEHQVSCDCESISKLLHSDFNCCRQVYFYY